MVHSILMPKPGQMTEECVLVAWHKQEGDPVARGDVLFEIETDKAVMDVEAFDEGVLLKRCVEEGQTVPVNTVCAYVGEPGEAIPEDARAAGSVAAGATPAVAAAATTATVPTRCWLDGAPERRGYAAAREWGAPAHQPASQPPGGRGGSRSTHAAGERARRADPRA